MNHTTPARLNVFVMQQDPLLRVGIAMALRQHSVFNVFEGELDDIEHHEPPIDVVIADYGRAFQLTTRPGRMLRPCTPLPKILTLTSNEKETDIRRAIEAGVHGYLLLGGEIGDLLEGVKAVANGMRYLGRSVAQRMADSLTRIALTSREIEVLRLVVSGESNKIIARNLNIEIGTVKTHMTAILSKLGATSRTHAAGIAVTRGLVGVPATALKEPMRPGFASRELHAQYA